jgi:mannitol/fructose-specific phosphotransferase system IIA component (Ntr-type)
MAIVDLMDERIVKVPITSTSKVDILKELVDVLYEAGKVSETQKAVDALIARENQGSTGLEAGIAVPHAKTEAVDEIAMALGISPSGVDFEAADGKLSHLFFLILAPPDKPGLHVELLSEIARLCGSPSVVKALMQANSPKEVVEIFKDE